MNETQISLETVRMFKLKPLPYNFFQNLLHLSKASMIYDAGKVVLYKGLSSLGHFFYDKNQSHLQVLMGLNIYKIPHFQKVQPMTNILSC